MVIKNKKKLVFLVVLALVLLSAPLMVGSLSNVSFNQLMLHKLMFKYGAMSSEDFFDALRANYSFGTGIIFGSQPPEPSFDDPQAVFAYVFSHIPSHAVVYTTEQLYYFTTSLEGNGEISGNIRVADLDKNILTFVYFQVENMKNQDNFKSYKPKEGIDIEIEKITNSLFRVTYDGKSVEFKIPDYTKQIPEIKTLPEESFIGRIMDESGTGLLLFFNEKTNSFYEVLDESRITDRFDPLEKGFVIGKRTGFIYFDDENIEYKRKILVGVNFENSKVDNFLDGPGDQVPIHVKIRDDLIKSNPGAALGNGTDEYGVMLGGGEWSRLIVGPFNFYTLPSDTIEQKSFCLNDQSTDKSTFWTCLTKENWNTPGWRASTITKLKAEGKYESLKERGLVD